MTRRLLAATALLLVSACGGGTSVSDPTPQAGGLRYLALGDSYTIGTGSSGLSASFPGVVSDYLRRATGRPVDLRNLGVNGYTTSDLIREELPHAAPYRPDYVTVLIGVNDWVQGVDESAYTRNLRHIYDSVALLGLPAAHVAVVSIPDFSYTPAAASFGAPPQIQTGLRAFNRLAAVEAGKRGWKFVDIFDLSRSRMGSPGWIAGDGLHPGDVQYRAWGDYIWGEIALDWTPTG